MSFGAAVVILASVSLQSERQMEDQILAVLKEKNIPGASVAVSRNGFVIYKRGFGIADLEHNAPMAADATHELASVSKQFTAAGILLLVQDGKLKLDEPISDIFSESPEDWKKITVKHLLNHTGGLPDYISGMRGPFDMITENRFLEVLKARKVAFPAGEKYQYSNSGYAMLGYIIERKSGQSLRAFMEDRIFKPLKLSGTMLCDPHAVIPGRAEGYTYQNSKFYKEAYTSLSMSRTADGHIYSTAPDLVKWSYELVHGTLLNDELKKNLFNVSLQSKKVEGDTTTGYSFGLNVVKNGSGTVLNHTGGWYGTSTILAYFVEPKIGVAVLCNRDNADTSPIIQALVNQFVTNKPKQN